MAADRCGVVPGLILTSVGTAMMSAALFTRRSRSGWLDELDGIRDDALAQPGGEVSLAMADVLPLADIDHDTSPLSVLEAPLPPAAARSASPARFEPAEAPMPSADPPPPAASPATGLRPPRLVAVETSASDPASDSSPAPERSGPVWAPSTVPPATRPAPHPVRPQEMWHPGVVAVPPPPVDAAPEADERIDHADLAGADDDGEGSSSRFRFARLRPVLSGPGPRRAGDGTREAVTEKGAPAAAETGGDDEGEAPYSLLDDLLAPSGAPPVEEETSPVGHGSVPLVPSVAPGASRTLITRPVIRRTERDDEFIRRRDLQATLEADRLAGHRPAGDEDPSTGGYVAEIADLPSSAETATATEPEPEPTPVRHRLSVADDRTVAVDGGHLRLADHAECEIHGDAGGVELELLDGWCWTANGCDATAPVVVLLPVGRLTVLPGATALAVVEVDRTSFVVVVAGEAALEHSGGRVRLRPGAMVLVPIGCNPQVDVASRDEIEADPLVNRNMSLDAQR